MKVGDAITVRRMDDTECKGRIKLLPSHGRFAVVSYLGKGGAEITTTEPLYNGKRRKGRAPRPDDWGKPKVTPDMSKKMFELRKQGMTYDEIGRAVGVTGCTARSHIVGTSGQNIGKERRL